MNHLPTPEQLQHLLGHAERRRLTTAEAARLRAGVQHLIRQLALAEPHTGPGQPAGLADASESN
ncbi:hypothetical protein LN042_18950 [Kitasatospora sp. RB6PN24]|uniref:hypothetical protein n=1 Tax=Kitasatospora humi TaxID=2893891 RepID=UPI001E31BFF8|nr:hypothetical protein [Kitasatospora humi]MCC9309135.1 hypothetical protein [Kitasatospora humi]